MPTSDARKRANAKWNASKDNIMVRVDTDDGTAIRSAAAAAGQSVTQFMLQSAKERIARDNGIATENVCALDYGAINAHIQKTGESVPEFLARAVSDTIERDAVLLMSGLKVK